MWLALRRLVLGLSLILAASAILLMSDLDRRAKQAGEAPHIAILQFASRSVLDDNVAGMIQGLANEGFVDGQTIHIQRFNAENDLPTANQIAKTITDGKFPLVMTSSTPCLQVVANANKSGKAVHVFAAVTDPFGAGVGISRKDPLDHPKHLVGIGTFQPVERAFEIARKMYPDLKQVGVVWNTAEACSEACVHKARAKCKELGITLLEANVDSSTGVLEAAHSVVARGAEALWIGGDNTVELAIDSLVTAAKKGRIPVFCNNPSVVDRGPVFGLGADYTQVGILAGELAGKILRGTDPASIPIKDVAPELLVLNTTALEGLKSPWTIPPDILARADSIYGPDGLKTKGGQAARKPQPGRTYKIGIAYFAPDPGWDVIMKGFGDALRERGFVEGQNLDVRKAHANGEIANITPILQNYDNSDVDLIVTMTTPCLTAACATVKRRPVVFSYVYDPIAAGAGKSLTDHLPHVTGVGSFPPLDDTLAMMRALVPGLKTVGTLYNTSEANSRKVVSVARELFEKEGTRLEEISITNSNEVYQAAQVLTQRGIDVLWISGDNTALLAFEGIVKAASSARLPLVINDFEFMEKGALAACGIGWYEPGHAAGVLAARVLLGEKPSTMPMQNLAEKRIAVNFAAAETLGVAFPADVLKEARFFAGLRSRLGRAAKVVLVQLVDNPLMDKACEGVIKGMEEAGPKQGRDLIVERMNAEGEPAQLPMIMAAVKTKGIDLLVTAGTPTLLAAAKAIRDIPIVFTVASDPKAVGIFQGDKRPANIAGVHDDPPVDRLIALALDLQPLLATVGTVWNPAEPNSEISVKKLRRVCKERNLTLREVTANNASELTEATESLCAQGANIIVVSADNLAVTGFAAIAQAARKHNVPIYATEVGLVEAGATAVVGDDYFEWGKQSGLLAAKVLAGVKPADLPLEKTAVQRTVIAEKPKPQAAGPKKWKMFLVCYSDSPLAEDATRGVHDGFKQAGLVEGKDFTLDLKNAQGDIATLNTIFAAIKSQGADLVMVFSTPTLQAAVHKFDKTPVVFSVVADAVVAGAAKSATDHLPNVTGITTEGSFAEMPGLLKECMPNVKRVGTLFTPGEANSVHNKDVLKGCLNRAGIELVELPVNSSAEVVDAAIALCSKDINAVCQCLDNLMASAFPTVARAADKANLPVFGFVSEQAGQGAVACLARDYYDAGLEGARVAARVIRGEDPAKIPIENLKKSTLIVNLKQAQKVGVKIPDSVIKRADKVIK
ncbi:MAG: ABC transporter substrate-binding protein [Planctomycetota bacterium]